MTETLLVPSDIPAGTYLETGGQVVLEGEHYASLTAGASHNWLTATAQSGYTGTAYLEALPDIDLLYQTEALTGSPSANYPIQFTTPGTYTVWSRSHAPNAAGDSLYVGLNGQLVTVTGGDPDQWTWANQQQPSGNPATLAITTSGVHTLTTSMREDGLRLDRLLLTTATTYTPTDFGPTETLRLSETEATTTLTRTIVYTYDDLYRLTEAAYSTAESFAYAYDAAGNQTAITETLNLTQTVVTTYTYNQANQLVTARANDDGTTWYYTFDRNGNLLRQTPGGTTAAEGETRYSYDGANRLVKVELYTGGSYTTLSTAAYNGVGERLSLTTYALGVPLTTTYTTAEGQLLVTAVGTQTTLSLYGQTQVAEYSSEWSYPLRDSTSSVRQTTNQSGVVTLARTYKPFGAILAESGPYQTAFGFLGAQLDQVSGLMYMGGRYYDPTTGRFLTPDYSRVNPYAPVQGPGIWLLLPLVGIVFAWKGRKRGAGRIVILVLVIGGLTTASCGEQPGSSPQPTPVPAPPQTPTPGQPLPEPSGTPITEPTPRPKPAPEATGLPTARPPIVYDAEVLEKTIRIIPFKQVNNCPTPKNMGPIGVIPLTGESLGTIIKTSDTILTHGHYSQWNNATHITFTNYQNDMTIEKADIQFLHQDAGTWVWKLPSGLVGTPATLGDPNQVFEGDTVRVPYQISDNQISVLEANITKTTGEEDGSPIFNLSSISDVPIIPGDSGGGIWFNGKVVGNTWATVRESTEILDNTGEVVKEKVRILDDFYAAKLPEGLLSEE